MGQNKAVLVLTALFFLSLAGGEEGICAGGSSARELADELNQLDGIIKDRLRESHKAVSPPKPAPQPEPVRAEPSPPNAQVRELEEAVRQKIRTSGHYRVGMGGGRSRTFSFNDADADLQDRDGHYLFGERLNNTYDPAIFSSYRLDVDADVTDRVSAYGEIVADPWSYVGTTGDVRIPEATSGLDSAVINLKYFGSNNSTIGEIYRADFRNFVSTPFSVEANDGYTTPFTMNGISDLGLRYDVPALELDYEFRPLRKLWVDYQADDWHMRVFALAGQDQVMTTDDPLGLSNTKDFWQPSPWTAKWVPLKRFADFGTTDVNGSIARGHYSDIEAFNAKTSYGEYLSLLRGVSMEADLGRAYAGGMIAAPFTPWDGYDEVNNLPGVFRVKHQVTPRWMVGGLYGFRVGLIDNEPDAYNQVISLDTSYALDPNVKVYGQMAGSRDEIDRLGQGNRRSPDGFKSDVEGLAYKGGVEADFDHAEGHSNFKADATWMDSDFRPHLSQYKALKDDNFWGRHMTFHEYSGDLEYFRLGTGADIGRTALRGTLRTDMMDKRLKNLFDVRHVRTTDKMSFIENVMRDEISYQLTPQLKAKGFGRWHLLPETETDVEPSLADFFFIDVYNGVQPKLQNDMIDPGLDPSKLSLGGGLQFAVNDAWTLEGTYERTNDIPDFPRALQNNVFLRNPVPDPNDPNILLDEVQYFVYHQDVYDLPPYDYFDIFKENVIYSPAHGLTFTFHAAQNGYELWGPIDEMVHHQGVSIDYRMTEQVSFFMDYTHSVIGNVPRWINTNFTELDFEDHHNVYAAVKYRIRPAMALNLEFGVFGETFGRESAKPLNPFSISEFSLPTIDTEHLFRFSLEGDF